MNLPKNTSMKHANLDFFTESYAANITKNKKTAIFKSRNTLRLLFLQAYQSPLQLKVLLDSLVQKAPIQT